MSERLRSTANQPSRNDSHAAGHKRTHSPGSTRPRKSRAYHDHKEDDDDEKQQQPNIACAVHIYKQLTSSLNVDDLPIPFQQQQQQQQQQAQRHSGGISELFVGGGKRYWQNVHNAAKLTPDEASLMQMASSDIELSTHLLHPQQPHLSSSPLSRMTPVTPQPTQVQSTRGADPYQSDSKYDHLSSPEQPHLYSDDMDDDVDVDDDDDSKYGEFDTKYGHTSGVDVPANVPFAIAALFDSMKPMQPHGDGEQYNQNVEHASNATIIDPNDSRETLSTPPDRIAQPDDQTLVAKSNFVRRLSFPLGNIEEHPGLERDDHDGEAAAGDGEHMEELKDLDIKRLSADKDDELRQHAQIDRHRANRDDVDDLYVGSAEHIESDSRDSQNGDATQERETRLQAAKQQVDNLEQELRQQRAEMEREKMELVNRTSAQIEMMRDELQHKERTIHKLVHIHREGYVPENDDLKNNVPSSSLWSTAIRNGISSLTFARSKFCAPVHTWTDTKKAKTNLAIASSREIDRLRSVIRALSTQQTTSAGGKRSGLVDAEYEEVYPGGASN